MKSKLLHELLTISEYVFEELTDDYRDDRDLGRRFWSYLKSNILNDVVKKIKVSDYVYSEILKIDVDEFNAKYGVRLDNVKKTKQQMNFLTSAVTTMLRYSDKGEHIIDWS